MRLSENSRGIEWLHQFTGHEMHLARLLLDSLKLVSHADFEGAMIRTIERICAETTGPIALFTPDKRLIDRLFRSPGSEDRLAHIFRNLQRQFTDRILITPTNDEMRANEIKHVLIVDDFVGSGERIESYWDVWASMPPLDRDQLRQAGLTRKLTRKRGRLRSWLSFGYCRLWLVGYAIHERGLRRSLDAIPYLAADRIRFEIRLSADEDYWPPEVRGFFQRNASRTGRYHTSLGGGNISCPLVFQHGCPDNCPAILWKNGPGFRALFTERAIPAALYPCFESENDCGRGPALLLKAGQGQLALSLIARMAHNPRSGEYSDLVTVLGLLLRGVHVDRLPQIMLREASNIQSLLSAAIELGLMDEQFKVTPFGRDLVKRTKTSFVAPPPSEHEDANRGIFYVPKRFQNNTFGVQRKPRNEPDANP